MTIRVINHLLLSMFNAGLLTKIGFCAKDLEVAFGHFENIVPIGKNGNPMAQYRVYVGGEGVPSIPIH